MLFVGTYFVDTFGELNVF